MDIETDSRTVSVVSWQERKRQTALSFLGFFLNKRTNRIDLDIFIDLQRKQP